MNSITTYAGECMYENFRLEYQIISLEYIPNSSIKIEAICFNPYNDFDKEAIFKYNTNSFALKDERFKIAILMINSLIDNLDLEKNNLRKLVVKNKKTFYIYKL